MPKNTLLSVGVSWDSDVRPIYEVAEIIENIITAFFSQPLDLGRAMLESEGHKRLLYEDSQWFTNQDRRDELAEYILRIHRRDIRKCNHEPNPDLTYSRDAGFSFILFFDSKVKGDLGFVVQLGTSKVNSLGTLRISQDLEADFDWYFRFLQTLVQATNSNSGAVRLVAPSFLLKANEYLRALGWINYFAHDYKVSIPDDLPGVEYLHTEKGKYLITTREDFTGQTKEIYEAHKQKLLVLMEEIALRDPRYRRT